MTSSRRLILPNGKALVFAALFCVCRLAVGVDSPACMPEPASLNARRIQRICREIEAIRELDFRSNVAVDVQSVEDFKAFVVDAIDREYGPDHGEGYARALAGVGALEHPVDMVSTLLDLLESQAAAYYDPDPGSKTYHLLSADMSPLVLDIVSSHELCHALQDQHHDLHAFIQNNLAIARDNGDAGLARQCLVEGDATVVMTIWTLMSQSGTDNQGLARTLATAALTAEASMSFNQLIRLAEMSMSADPSFAGLAGSIEDLRGSPRFFVELLLASYLKGAVMVEYIRSKGGWEAVDALYGDPPQSTEQVLHPEKLIGERENPVEVSLADLEKDLSSSWRKVDEDVMGEMGLRAFLSLWLGPTEMDDSTAVSAAAGWGGDRYCFFEDTQLDSGLLVWKTVWDTLADGAEFVTAYRATLPRRFPNVRKTRRSPPGNPWTYQVWEVEPGRFLKLVRHDKTVGIIDTTDRTLLDILWK